MVRVFYIVSWRYEGLYSECSKTVASSASVTEQRLLVLVGRVQCMVGVREGTVVDHAAGRERVTFPRIRLRLTKVPICQNSIRETECSSRRMKISGGRS